MQLLGWIRDIRPRTGMRTRTARVQRRVVGSDPVGHVGDSSAVGLVTPAIRIPATCDHCQQPILRLGRLWVHDRRVYDERCIVASRYTGTVAEPKEAP